MKPLRGGDILHWNKCGSMLLCVKEVEFHGQL